MQMLTIEATSLDSAQRLYSALSVFHPELLTDEGGDYRVSVALADDRNTLAVLNALEQYVTDRDDGPARFDLNGHGHTLYARRRRPMSRRRSQQQLLEKWLADFKRLDKGRSPRLPGQPGRTVVEKTGEEGRPMELRDTGDDGGSPRVQKHGREFHEEAALLQDRHAEHARALGDLEMARQAEGRAERARERARRSRWGRGTDGGS